MPTSQPLEAQHPAKKISAADQNEEQTLSWSCVMGDEKFIGESRVRKNHTTDDTWYDQSGAKKHMQHTDPNWKFDVAYEGPPGKEVSTSQLGLMDGNQYGAFKGTNEGKAATYGFIIDGGQLVQLTMKSADGEEYIDIPEDGKTYKDALDQKSRIKFEPPCPKPRT